MDAHIKTGDLVIGNSDPSRAVFSNNGKKLNDGVFFAGSETSIEEIANSMLKTAVRAGAKIEPMKKSKTKKQAKSTYTRIAPITKGTQEKEEDRHISTLESSNMRVEQPVKKETITFENAFGRMRVAVENILEHDFAFLLVFTDSQQLIFEPKIGESLALQLQAGESYQVYYPGVIFDWPDGVKKAMLLFKKTEE
jgi:hypothetical protein